MNKTIIIGAILLVAVAGGYFFFQSGDGGSQAPQESGIESQTSREAGGQSSSAERTSPSGLVIPIRNHKIVNPTVTVPVDTTITWSNEDNLSGFPYDSHSPTSGTIDPSGAQGQKGVVPNSGSGVADRKFALVLSSGESQSFTFAEPGTYTYYIAEHPLVSGEGKVIVEESKEPISMSAGSFFFSQETLSATTGEKVSLEITATGQHTFTIDELGVDVSLPNGRTTSVDFTPTQKGTFTYYCAIPGHREAGQTGTLTVE